MMAYNFRGKFLECLVWLKSINSNIRIIFDYFSFSPKLAGELGPIEDYWIVLVIGLPLFNFALSNLGAYRSMRFRTWAKLLKLAFIASGVVFLGSSAIMFVLNQDISRSFVGSFCLLSFFALFFERIAVLALLRWFRIRGKNYRNLLVVGTGKNARNIANQIAEMPELGIRVQGFVGFDDSPAPPMRKFANAQLSSPENLQTNTEAQRHYNAVAKDLPILATLDTFEDSLKKYAIDEVLFTDTEKHYDSVLELSKIAKEEGITITFAGMFYGFDLAKSEISYFGSTPLVHFEATPSSTKALFSKRLLDLVVSTISLVILFPVMLVTAILIKLDSKGPIFFKQRRVGLNGRLFTLLKFRSMFPDAEEKLEALRDLNEMSGPAFKIANDPRITKIGSFLRKYSIDELPQLINVLLGDMSLVGPRPPLPSEVKEYKRKHRRRLSMRPGITCTWQVSGRNSIPNFEDWTELDLDYIDNWSFRNDLRLLLKTIPAVVRGTGAN